MAARVVRSCQMRLIAIHYVITIVAPTGSMSKAAKKNAKRKEKRAEEKPDDDDPPPVFGEPLPPMPQAPAAGSREAVCQKLILKTQKKIKQCDALVKRQAAGEKLTKEEDDKLAKMPGWCARQRRCINAICYRRRCLFHVTLCTGRRSCGSCSRTWSLCLFHDTC